MIAEHFPSLELCKKLTMVGFPDTEIAWCNMAVRSDSAADVRMFDGDKSTPRRVSNTVAVCPSVMEMLDVIEPTIYSDRTYTFFMTAFSCEYRFFNGVDFERLHIVTSENLPNALAEMIIWLVENNYLSFTEN